MSLSPFKPVSRAALPTNATFTPPIFSRMAVSWRANFFSSPASLGVGLTLTKTRFFAFAEAFQFIALITLSLFKTRKPKSFNCFSTTVYSESWKNMDLGSGIRKALAKITGASVVDEKSVLELVKELQRVLITNDVNVKLVFE